MNLYTQQSKELTVNQDNLVRGLYMSDLKDPEITHWKQHPKCQGFTARSLIVIGFAENEARRFGHPEINAGHLLVGFLRRGGLAFRALEDFTITVTTVRYELEKICPGVDGVLPFDSIPLSPQLESIIEGARSEMQKEPGRDTIGPEHLLLAMIGQGEKIGTQILLNLLNGDIAELKKHLRELIESRHNKYIVVCPETFVRLTELAPSFGVSNCDAVIKQLLDEREARQHKPEARE